MAPEWIITGPEADTMGAGGLLGAGYVNQISSVRSAKLLAASGAKIGNGVVVNHGWGLTKCY
jgi:hypothetical protein